MIGSCSSVDCSLVFAMEATAFAAALFALISGLLRRGRFPVMVFWSSRLCSLRSCSRRWEGVGFLADLTETMVFRAAKSAKL